MKLKVMNFDQIESTHEINPSIHDADNLFVVVADTQLNGYGQYKRIWHSPRGNLYATYYFLSSDFKLFSIIAARALLETIIIVANVRAELKWPNDIVIDGKKIAGILTNIISATGNAMYVKIGIGINNRIRPMLLTSSISLLEIGVKISNKILLRILSERLMACIDTDHDSNIYFINKHINKFGGKDVAFDYGCYDSNDSKKIYTGSILGINDSGGLAFKDRVFYSGRIISG